MQVPHLCLLHISSLQLACCTMTAGASLIITWYWHSRVTAQVAGDLGSFPVTTLCTASADPLLAVTDEQPKGVSGVLCSSKHVALHSCCTYSSSGHAHSAHLAEKQNQKVSVEQ